MVEFWIAGPLPAVLPPPFDHKTAGKATSRQGVAEPYTILDSPADWTGDEYPDPAAVATHVTERHIQELEAAIQGLLDSDLVARGTGNYLAQVGWN